MKRILASIKDNEPLSMEIVRLACLMCKEEKAQLLLIYVYEVPLSLPLDEEMPKEMEIGEAILNKALEITEEIGVSVETGILQARTAGAGIVTELSNTEIDAVVMGMKRSTSPGRTIIGSTPEHVLKLAECRVILVAPSMEKKLSDE